VGRLDVVVGIDVRLTDEPFRASRPRAPAQHSGAGRSCALML
jgi:hypothetical protein